MIVRTASRNLILAVFAAFSTCCHVVHAEGDEPVQAKIERAATIITGLEEGEWRASSTTAAQTNSPTAVTVTWFGFPTWYLGQAVQLQWQIETDASGRAIPELELVLAQTDSSAAIDSENSWVVLVLTDRSSPAATIRSKY